MVPQTAWVEVRLACPMGWEELAAEALGQEPCTAVAFGVAQDGSTPAPGQIWVTTYISAAEDCAETRELLCTRWQKLARASGEPSLMAHSLSFSPLPAEDYANSWKKSWKAFRIGRLCVVPPWQQIQLRPTDIRLTLEPGGAFGSGRHATTRMCLKVLQERLRGGESLLDAGSGSGILAVAACLLGARRALGFDVDRHAQASAEHLALENRVNAHLRFCTSGFEVLTGAPGPYDVILANIYSDVIALHAAQIAACLSKDGWFALSGCPRDQLPATLEVVGQAGLIVEEVRTRGRWRTLVGRREGT